MTNWNKQINKRMRTNERNDPWAPLKHYEQRPLANINDWLNEQKDEQTSM